jgi:hypothetical protein
MLSKSKSKSTYQIKKIMKRPDGNVVHVLMLDGNSEVYEDKSSKEAGKLCDMLNKNTDSGWFYAVIEVKSI